MRTKEIRLYTHANGAFYFLCRVKILIVHQHFKEPAEGGAIRSYYLASALIKRGHRVVVITGGTGQNVQRNIEGIEVIYLKVPYDNAFRFYARARSFVRFVISAGRTSRKFSDFDVCYTISVPLTVGLIARWIKWRLNMPYIFEVGDLWPDAPVQMGVIKNYFLKSSLYAVEKSIYRNAESIVALSPTILSAIEQKVPARKLFMIPNMADCEFYHPEEKSKALETKFGAAGKFVVSYIGALGAANGLDYFIECANASRKASLPIHFLLCGDGAMKASITRDIARLGLNNISILDFVNREGVRDVMNVTDAVFVCYKNVPILETGSPNKFFDGLAAGKLIVLNFGGWIKEEIEKNSCGFSVDPMQPTDFVKKISPFVADRGLLLQYQGSARLLGETKYSREKLGNAFVEIIESH
jgi:glycosyltransferase involved in cell wall biosynthesis